MMRAGLTVKIKRLLLVGAAAIVLAAAYLAWGPLVVRWHHARAREYLDTRHNRQAVQELEAALRQASDCPETFLLLARAHRRLGHLSEAADMLRRAVAAGAERDRAEREGWLVMAQSGQLREAEPHLPELLIDPRDDGPDICEAYVHGYFGNLLTGAAQQLLDLWEKDYPEDPQVHFMRGFLLQSLSRQADAAAAYRRGLELDPSNTAMRHRFALLLMSMGEQDQAGDEIQRCLGEDPQNPDYLCDWARWLEKRGQLDRAREILEALVQQAPDHFEARQLFSEVELSQGRSQQALPHLEAAVRQRPSDRTARLALARTLQQLGRAKEAKPHFDYVAEADKMEREIKRLVRLAVAHPRDVDTRCQIATLLFERGLPEEAAKWLRTVLQLQPEHREANQRLAAFLKSHRAGPMNP